MSFIMPTSLFERMQRAKRTIHREEMNRFGNELSWIANPAEIPTDAISGYEGHERQCHGLARWMISELAAWSGMGHRRLDMNSAFKQYDVPYDTRFAVRESFRENPHFAYAPGLLALSEIFAVVPQVAARDNVPSGEWPLIAARAQKFGELLAKDATEVQSIIREYLWDEVIAAPDPDGSGMNLNYHRLDPAKLKLDPETGITTVTPMHELIAVTNETVHLMFKPNDFSACIALQAKSPIAESSNMFGAVWRAFGYVAEHQIYPQAVVPAEIVPQAEADPNFRQAAQMLLAKLVAETH